MKRLFLLAMIALLLAASGCCRPLLQRPLFPRLFCRPCQQNMIYDDQVIGESTPINESMIP